MKQEREKCKFLLQIRGKNYHADLAGPNRDSHPQMEGKLVGLYTQNNQQVWPKNK